MSYYKENEKVKGKYLLSENEYKIMFYIARAYYEKENAGILSEKKSCHLEKVCEQAIKHAENQIPKDHRHILKKYILQLYDPNMLSDEQSRTYSKWRQRFLWHLWESLKNYEGYTSGA